MKRLHLIRHAKSSWEDDSLADIDRPLNHRGIKSCRVMAPHLVNAGCYFHHVYCSPANRAQSTIQFISQQIPEFDIRWKTDDSLYCFDSGSLLHWLRSWSDDYSEITLIGHNPAITGLCNYLANTEIQNIPTCGYVQLLTTQSGRWHHISDLSFDLVEFLQPKMFL